MEDVLDNDPQYDGLQLTAESRVYLTETAKWAKFLSVVGFVVVSIMVLVGLFFSTFMGSAMSDMGHVVPELRLMGGMMGIFYVIFALIYFFPCYYLFKFSTTAKRALANNDTHQLTEALKNHKSVYKFMGILMIIILGFYAFSLVLGLGAFILTDI